MSKLIKAMLLSAYSALFVHYIRTNLFENTKDEVDIDYLFASHGALKRIHREIKKFKGNVTAYSMNFQKPMRLPTDMKFILKWTEAYSHYSSSIFKNGQKVFVENNCTHSNCFFTNDKSILVDVRYFDAILFDVENNWDTHPILRAPYQKYIFTASESASHYPVCAKFYDTYYNLSWTYKLDSDIRWTYVTILDKNGTTVGPAIDMKWVNPMQATPEEVKDKLKTKKKAAAWFVSNCRAKSGREAIAKDIESALTRYGLKVDIYGWCGRLKCPRERLGECLNLLERDYYFYFSFENSLCDDYVTEKILYPLQHYTVPIVFGGANYSRFLPPGSYINAGELSADAVAALMNKAIKDPEVYHNYFRWHNHYEYIQSPKTADLCVLCKVLNDKHRSTSVVNNFRKWWNPDYERLCREELKG